ncbi:hypothetical protein [Neobacillus dielmonensis]|uniref:hypothetical protein n=1 Tax=Neobacillus dielmonensis TaxID=1347369 RepID=UPI0005AA58AB|nr:hypothetical protein [Neobacillus dielmonensis]
MKKLVIGVFSAAFLLGAGTAVFAAGNNDSSSGFSFEEMLPFMQKMHPDSSQQDLENMYKACQESGGTMGSTKSLNMMNRF